MEYPTATAGMQRGYGSNNYDGASMDSYAKQEREPIFPRVSKQIDIISKMTAEAAERAAQLADRIAGPQATLGAGLNGDSARPVQGIVDDWSDQLRNVQTTLDRVIANLSRIESQL